MEKIYEKNIPDYKSGSEPNFDQAGNSEEIKASPKLGKFENFRAKKRKLIANQARKYGEVEIVDDIFEMKALSQQHRLKE